MRWRMAGRLLIFEIMRFLLITIPTGVMQAFIFGGSVAAAAGGDLSVLAIVGFIGSTLFGLVANVLVVPLYAIYITVNYLDLRIRKEQLDLQLQAAQLAPALSEQPAAVSPAAPGASARAPTAGPTELPPVTAASPAALPRAGEVRAATVPPAVIGPASSATAQPIVDTSMTPAQRISVLFNQIRTEGENAELLNELGLAYHQIGDLYGALDALTRARARAPNDPAIAYNMAVLQRDRRDMPAARRAMADYLRLETDEAERQRVLANPSLRDLLPQQ
jgi:tetratricopeptide (TPR) repeat protein